MNLMIVLKLPKICMSISQAQMLLIMVFTQRSSIAALSTKMWHGARTDLVYNRRFSVSVFQCTLWPTLRCLLHEEGRTCLPFPDVLAFFHLSFKLRF